MNEANKYMGKHYHCPIRHSRRNKRIHKKRHLRLSAAGWVLTIFIAVASAIVLNTYVIQIVWVDGNSMYPTLYSDERVLVEKVSRYFSLPKRGQIITVNYPDRKGEFVKRVIGLPGDVVEIKDNVVYLNSKPLSEAYINLQPYPNMGGYEVPADHIFVMGDNRADSLDSRAAVVGPIPKDYILGTGIAVIWPIDELKYIN